MSGPREKRFSFAPTYKTLQEILDDGNLAALGDAYINLVYSLYLSMKTGTPTGTKTNNRILSNALRQAGLRNFMASRVDRHKQADAAEALLVYCWLQGLTTISRDVRTLVRCKSVDEGFSSLLSDAKRKLGV
jgi:hypothetical protein